MGDSAGTDLGYDANAGVGGHEFEPLVEVAALDDSALSMRVWE